MKQLLFSLLVWLLPFTINLQAQILYGSACTAPSSSYCKTLDFAIQLTKDTLDSLGKIKSNQFGLVRLQSKHNIASGLDGQLCLHFGNNTKGGDKITFFIQGDTIKQNSGDSCNSTITLPDYNYFSQVDTFFAIELQTIEDDAANNKFDSVRIYLKRKGEIPLAIWKAFKVPFDLDNENNIDFRIVYNPLRHRMQLYLDGIQVFDICVNLEKDIIGKETVFLTMSGQTGDNPDVLTVSVRASDYDMCRIGSCKKDDAQFFNWMQSRLGTKANWERNINSQSVEQTSQDNVSFLLDPCINWINVRIKFKAQVNPDVLHNGYWGFVWGWQDYFCSDPDQYEGYLFGWRHEPGTLNGYPANEARIFSKMHGDIPEASIVNHFWANAIGPSWSPLAPSQNDPDDWWIPGTEYRFELEYSVIGTRIKINDTEVLYVQALPGKPNLPGQFGFYTYEQAGVKFRDVQYEYLDNIILPNDTLCQNVGISFQVENLPGGYDATHIQSFAWSFSNTPQLVLPASINEIVHLFEQPGIETVTLNITTNFNNCILILKKSVQIVAFDPPRLPEDTMLCPWEVLYLDVFDHKYPKATYLWQDGSTFSAFSGASPGKLWVQKTSADSLCVAKDSILLTYYPAPDIFLQARPSCEEQNNGGLTGQISGGSPPFLFTFNGNQSDQLSFGGLSPINENISITDGKGCIFEEEVSIGSEPRPVIEVQTRDISCHGLKDGRITIAQSAPDVLFSLDGQSFSGQRIFSQLDAGAHTLYYRDATQCVYDTTVNLREPESFSIRIQAPAAVAIPGDSVLLEATIIPGGLQGQIQWLGPALSCDTCGATFAHPLRSAVYRVILTDSNGCTATDKITLLVPNDTLVYIPNIFKPDGNGTNARVWVSAFPLVSKIKSWQIFHRRYGLVFEKSDFMPNDPRCGWDGVFKGKLLNPGVFTYFIEFEVFGQAESRVLQGDITLFR